MTKKKSKDIGVTRQNALMIGIIGVLLGFIIGVAFASYKLDKTVGIVADKQQFANYEEKVNTLKAELLKNPENISVWVQLGHIYFDADQYIKAIDAYEKSLSLEPNNADVLTDLGIMYRRNGQPKKAIASFDKAIFTDSKHENSRFNKGIVLMNDIKDRKSALEVWESLLEINPIAMVGKNQSLDQLIRHYKEH